MTSVVLIILVVLWVAVLLPPWLRSRNDRAFRPARTDGQSIAMHRTQLNVLNTALGSSGAARENVIPFRRPEAGAPVAASLSAPEPVQRSFAGLAQPEEEFDFGPAAGIEPMNSEGARRRRRNVLAGLAGFALLTLIAAVTQGGMFFVLLHLVADVALLGFVFLLVQHHQRSMDAANKVRPIRPVGYTPGPQAAPEYLVQRSSAQ